MLSIMLLSSPSTSLACSWHYLGVTRHPHPLCDVLETPSHQQIERLVSSQKEMGSLEVSCEYFNGIYHSYYWYNLVDHNGW